MFHIYLHEGKHIISALPGKSFLSKYPNSELVSSVSSLESAKKVADKRYPNWVVDDTEYVPREKTPEKDKPRSFAESVGVYKAFKRQLKVTRNKLSNQSIGHSRYKRRSWNAHHNGERKMLWVRRPDGTGTRKWIAEGDTLPYGWSFGRSDQLKNNPGMQKHWRERAEHYKKFMKPRKKGSLVRHRDKKKNMIRKFHGLDHDTIEEIRKDDYFV